MESNLKFIIDEVCYFLIDGTKHEIYQGSNKMPFYYEHGKEVYLNTVDKKELDNLLKK